MRDVMLVVCGNAILVGIGVAAGALVFGSMVAMAVYDEVANILSDPKDRW